MEAMAAPSPVEKAQDKQRSFKETYLYFSCNSDWLLGRVGIGGVGMGRL